MSKGETRLLTGYFAQPRSPRQKKSRAEEERLTGVNKAKPHWSGFQLSNNPKSSVPLEWPVHIILSRPITNGGSVKAG